MESNKRALMILQLLVLTAVVIFLLEKKFLVYESRGATLSHYEDVNGTEKVLLLVDDFEGFNANGAVITDSTLKKNGFFDYGSAKISLTKNKVDNNPLASKTALELSWTGKDPYGGWGKGVGANIELDPLSDYLNFRVLVPASNGFDEVFKIMMQEDDNGNGQ